jgi:hypothetical protein
MKVAMIAMNFMLEVLEVMVCEDGGCRSVSLGKELIEEAECCCR